MLAIHAVLFLAPPLPYTDVFNYINYGRMGVVHHLNPYGVLPALEPHSRPELWAQQLASPAELRTVRCSRSSPTPSCRSAFTAPFSALKLLVGAASLATLALLWRCARALDRSPTAAVVFVGSTRSS